MSVTALPVPVLASTVTTSVETVEYEVEADSDFAEASPSLAAFGPFRVIDGHTAEVVDVIDSDSPRQFRRMLAAYPGLRQLRMIDCPGTEDDDANLLLARMVRAARLDTHVPKGGSVRSGGVELFMAGVRRSAESGAEFGVHSWQDSDGREARDFAASSPVHRNYLSYYQDMGLDAAKAQAFYSLTNATAHRDVRYLTPAELSRFGILN